MAKRSALAKQHHLRLTSMPAPAATSARAESPLHVRTRLRERRPVSVKRHTARIATRLGVLLAADIGAIVVCAVLASAAAEQSFLGAWVNRVRKGSVRKLRRAGIWSPSFPQPDFHRML